MAGATRAKTAATRIGSSLHLPRAADRPAPGPWSCPKRPRRCAHQPYFYGLRFSRTD